MKKIFIFSFCLYVTLLGVFKTWAQENTIKPDPTQLAIYLRLNNQGKFYSFQQDFKNARTLNELIILIDLHPNLEEIILTESERMASDEQFKAERNKLINEARKRNIIVQFRQLSSLYPRCSKGYISSIYRFDSSNTILARLNFHIFEFDRNIKFKIDNYTNHNISIQDIILEEFINNNWLEKNIDLFCHCDVCDVDSVYIEKNKSLELQWDQSLCALEYDDPKSILSKEMHKKISKPGKFRFRLHSFREYDYSGCLMQEFVISYSDNFRIVRKEDYLSTMNNLKKFSPQRKQFFNDDIYHEVENTIKNILPENWSLSRENNAVLLSRNKAVKFYNHMSMFAGLDDIQDRIEVGETKQYEIKLILSSLIEPWEYDIIKEQNDLIKVGKGTPINENNFYINNYGALQAYSKLYHELPSFYTKDFSVFSYSTRHPHMSIWPEDVANECREVLKKLGHAFNVYDEEHFYYY